ncbi:MAG TPA: hypothetical protein VFX15_03000 [Actinomycetes bacterium]|nr:hypothetical protein [Actinomycetes bacterium]
MDALPAQTTVLLRRGNASDPGRFERLVREIIRSYAVHLEYRWVMPDPAAGPGAAFLRDNEMVAASDLVLAFFAPGRMMEGGTGHVVESAIDKNVPVYSFILGETLARVGEHDPDAIWQQQVRAYFDAEEEL